MTLEEFSNLVDEGDPWDILGLSATSEIKAIKRAYAARLKIVRPEDAPALFQTLREAYEWALALAPHVQIEDQPDAPAPFDVFVEAVNTFGVPPETALDTEITAQITLPETAFPSQSIEFFNLGPVQILPELAPELNATILDEAFEQPKLFDLACTLADFQLAARANMTPGKDRVKALIAWLSSCGALVPLHQRDLFEREILLQIQSDNELHFAAQRNALWPDSAIIAAHQFFRWDSDVNNRFSQSLRRAINTAETRIHFSRIKRIPNQRFSRSGALYRLQRPFSLLSRIFLGLVPSYGEIPMQIFAELERDNVAPEAVFNPKAVVFERNLARFGLGWELLLILLVRCLAFTAVFLTLAPLFFKSNDFVFNFTTALMISLSISIAWLFFLCYISTSRKIWHQSFSSVNLNKKQTYAAKNSKPFISNMLCRLLILFIVLQLIYFGFNIVIPMQFLSFFIAMVIAGPIFTVIVTVSSSIIVMNTPSLENREFFFALLIVLASLGFYFFKKMSGKADLIYLNLMKPPARVVPKQGDSLYRSAEVDRLFYWLSAIFIVLVTRHFTK